MCIAYLKEVSASASRPILNSGAPNLRNMHHTYIRKHHSALQTRGASTHKEMVGYNVRIKATGVVSCATPSDHSTECCESVTIRAGPQPPTTKLTPQAHDSAYATLTWRVTELYSASRGSYNLRTEVRMPEFRVACRRTKYTMLQCTRA